MLVTYVITTLMCQHGKDRPHRLLTKCDCGNKNHVKLEENKNPPYRLVVECTTCYQHEVFAVRCCWPIVWGQENLLEVIG